MKEYVAVPDALLSNTKELSKYLGVELRVCQDAQAQAEQEAEESRKAPTDHLPSLLTLTSAS